MVNVTDALVLYNMAFCGFMQCAAQLDNEDTLSSLVEHAKS